MRRAEGLGMDPDSRVAAHRAAGPSHFGGGPWGSKQRREMGSGVAFFCPSQWALSLQTAVTSSSRSRVLLANYKLASGRGAPSPWRLDWKPWQGLKLTRNPRGPPGQNQNTEVRWEGIVG